MENCEINMKVMINNKNYKQCIINIIILYNTIIIILNY